MPIALDPNETFEVALDSDRPIRVRFEQEAARLIDASPKDKRLAPKEAEAEIVKAEPDILAQIADEEVSGPAFVFRFMSSREKRKAEAVHEAWDKHRQDLAHWTSEGRRRALDAIYESLKARLAGWRNIVRAFDPDGIDDVLTDAEAVELHLKSLRNMRLTVPEKNASGSPSPAATPSSAPAHASAGSAPTSLRPPSP